MLEELSDKIRMCDLADEAGMHPSGASVSPDREIDARRAPAAVEGACSLSQAARRGVSSGRDCDGVRLRRSKPPHPHFQEVSEDYARTIQTKPPLALKARPFQRNRGRKRRAVCGTLILLSFCRLRSDG